MSVVKVDEMKRVEITDSFSFHQFVIYNSKSGSNYEP